MKILWIGFAPWSSRSYSVITRRVVPLLVEAGHSVAILASNYDGAPQQLGQNILLVGAPFVTAELAERLIRELGLQVILISHITFLEGFYNTTLSVPMAGYGVFHTKDEITPSHFLRYAQVKMVMSKYGQEQLDDLGIRTGYVPMCAPGDIFNYRPRPAARQLARLPALRLTGQCVIRCLIRPARIPLWLTRKKSGHGEILAGWNSGGWWSGSEALKSSKFATVANLSAPCPWGKLGAYLSII